MGTQPNRGRGDWGLILAIGLGLLLGFLIKKVHIGLLIGLVLGLLSSVLWRRK